MADYAGRPASYKVLTVGPDIHGSGGLCALMRVYARVSDRFHMLPFSSRNGRIAGFLTEMSTLLRMPFCRLAGYNVLHVHATSDSFFFRASRALRWGQKLGFRTIVHCHNDDFADFLAPLDKKHARAISRASAVLVLSDSWITYFSKTLGCRRVVVIPNLVPDVRIVRNRAKRRPEEPLRLLYMGKLTQQKGVYDLVRALEPLAAKYQSYLQLAIAGSGESDQVIALIDELKLDRIVTFEGWVDEKEKDRLMRLSDVLILPSYREGMPVGILEAGIYGMACIATSVGAMPDVVDDGVNGFLVDPGEPDQLTDAIQFYLDNPRKISEHGAAAREHIAAFLPAPVLARLDALYSSLV